MNKDQEQDFNKEQEPPFKHIWFNRYEQPDPRQEQENYKGKKTETIFIKNELVKAHIRHLMNIKTLEADIKRKCFTNEKEKKETLLSYTKKVAENIKEEIAYQEAVIEFCIEMIKNPTQDEWTMKELKTTRQSSIDVDYGNLFIDDDVIFCVRKRKIETK